jgi:hypothetical protein
MTPSMTFGGSISDRHVRRSILVVKALSNAITHGDQRSPAYRSSCRIADGRDHARSPLI